MPSSSLKHELADHIYQYLCHEAQYSDLPEAAKESLTAASECIEQAYKLNVGENHQGSNLSSTSKQNDIQQQQNQAKPPADILPDELLRIFMRHKEFLAQQNSSLIYPLRNNDRDEATSTSNDKPDIRVNNNINQAANSSNDPQNNINSCTASSTNNYNSNNMSPTLNSSNNMTSPVASNQQQLASSSSNNNAINQPQATAGATSTTATSSATTSTKHHNQHPISQLPMTTRKKLSHLRAQIKRQASKAARSRLEKRSSVSGSGGDKSSSGGHFGVSLDAASSSKHHGGDGHHRELHNQPNSSSSTESPSAYLINQSTSSPATGGNNPDSNANTTLSPSSQDASGSGPSGNAKYLVGQHSLAAPGQHGHHHHHHHHSLHQKNFKQKIIALLKKFRTDGSDFDSEEQYRAALERELLAVGRDSTAIDELLEEDIDVEEESGSEPEDWDNISESSTPKPSLRPFFSSTTLDKI